MAPHHCPFCNGSRSAAIAPVAFSGHVVVEHHCNSCGRLFCIMDRRQNHTPDEYAWQTARLLEAAS